MEENIYYTNLFDIYGSLLTEKQQSYFKDYYFENLLIDEICENAKVSKNAVSKQIKQAKTLLDYYEKELDIYKWKNAIQNEFKNEEEILNRISKYDNIIM